jgi:hypothetical protein
MGGSAVLMHFTQRRRDAEKKKALRRGSAVRKAGVQETEFRSSGRRGSAVRRQAVRLQVGARCNTSIQQKE